MQVIFGAQPMIQVVATFRSGTSGPDCVFVCLFVFWPLQQILVLNIVIFIKKSVIILSAFVVLILQ